MKKIAIVGAGAVGAHIAYAGILKDLPAEFLLVDVNEELEQGQVLDLRDAMLFSDSKNIRGVDFGDAELSDADIFIITAGVAQKPGETRIDLLKKNTAILKSISESIGKIKEDAIVIMVTNPLDIMTEYAHRLFGLPRGQVFGTGTLLDSSRLCWHLAEKFNIHPENIRGFVLGEHGDSEFVAWSSVGVFGRWMEKKLSSEEKERLEQVTKNEAYEIIKKKGATYFGIGAMTAEILSTVLSDRKTLLPVSAHLEGEFGISSVSLGVPAVIGEKGVESIWECDLEEDEVKKLQHSAKEMQKYLEEV